MAARARSLIARVPAAAWACALVAFLNVAAWSIVTPPFQVPDEQSHYAYAEYVAQHGRPPVPQAQDVYSGSQAAALRDLRFDAVRFVPDNGVLWTARDPARLERDLRTQGDRAGGNGGANAVGGEPPLFYALQAIPYTLAGGTVLDRLALMRLLSALLGGVTVLFAFLFLRELLPGHPWCWTVGALGAALATGTLTKFNAIGLLPGVALGLAAIGVRQEGGPSLRALRLPALALAIGVAPALLEMALNAAVWDRPAIGASASSFALEGDIHPTLGGGISYLWQFYFIPLPDSAAPIGGLPLWESWFNGFVGLFGWIDTEWPRAVYLAALAPAAAIFALAGRALVTGRDAVRRRGLEAGVYALIAATFAIFVAGASYIIYVRFDQSVAQARYLLPLLSLYGALLALAVRGAGRWAPVVGSAIVVLAIAHGLFAQLLVISRYYA